MEIVVGKFSCGPQLRAVEYNHTKKRSDQKGNTLSGTPFVFLKMTKYPHTMIYEVFRYHNLLVFQTKPEMRSSDPHSKYFLTHSIVNFLAFSATEHKRTKYII